MISFLNEMVSFEVNNTSIENERKGNQLGQKEFMLVDVWLFETNINTIRSSWWYGSEYTHKLTNHIIQILFLHLLLSIQNNGLGTFFIAFSWVSVTRLTIIRLWFYTISVQVLSKGGKRCVHIVYQTEFVRDNNLRLGTICSV